MGLVLSKFFGAKLVSKRVIEGKGLWRHCVENAQNTPKAAVKLVGKEAGPRVVYEEEWQQKDLMVLPSSLSSLVPTPFDAHFCCERARVLGSTLSQVYGNRSILSRVFDRSQEDMKDLRPQSIDPEVVDLFLTLKPAGSNILRSEKLVTLVEVGGQPRKEECPRGSIKTKAMWSSVSQAGGSAQGIKAVHKEEDRGSMKGDHMKKGGWVLNPKLKPAKSN